MLTQGQILFFSKLFYTTEIFVETVDFFVNFWNLSKVFKRISSLQWSKVMFPNFGSSFSVTANDELKTCQKERKWKKKRKIGKWVGRWVGFSVLGCWVSCCENFETLLNSSFFRCFQFFFFRFFFEFFVLSCVKKTKRKAKNTNFKTPMSWLHFYLQSDSNR